MSASNRMDGKVAVVTGGSRGIGRAAALALAERGANIAVLSRTMAASEAVADLVRGQGRQALAGAGDVSSWDDVQRLVQATVDALGPIDILLNNAGSGGTHGYVWNLDQDVFRETLMTNVLGPFHFMKAVLPGMVERHAGVVINVSSGAVRYAGVARAMYGTSKSGLDYLSKSATVEAAQAGVRVYSLYPGPTDTDMQAGLRSDPGMPPELQVQMQARLTEGRLFRPEQPAAGIAWLASPAGAVWTEPICPWSTAEVRAQIETLPGYVAG